MYSLSLLIESLILHAELIVLNTLPDDDRLSQAASAFGDAVWVENRSTEDIVERYAMLNWLTPDDLNHGPPAEWSGSGKMPPHFAAAEDASMQLYALLANGARDKHGELRGYLEMLDAVHREQFEHGSSGWPRVGRTEPVLNSDGHGMRLAESTQPRVNIAANVGIADRTELRELAAAGSTAAAFSDFVKRHNYRRETLWNAARRSRETYLTEFTPALLMRTHFYLLASEVFAAPYRPDVLRAPICWKFFERGPFADLTIDERMVDLADATARARVESANQLIGRPVLTALPLFLGRVLATSSKPTEIVARTLQIRDSADARRFRKAMTDLAAAQADGDISALVRDSARYSDLLRREYGSGGTGTADVLWSLAADGTKAALDPTATSFVSLGTSVGKTAVRTPDLLRRWSYGRKVALIGRTIRAANKAKAMQNELQRLFGAELTTGDLEFLDKVGRLGFD
ncbi:hypothetical protein ACQPYH_06360 [Kribbella sp. CA-245084]|uniref:hypothetical protein n=1 Tax=Kribbella sp. CA-245084 TaxID=3239940 RepID=UPI003D8B6913